MAERSQFHPEKKELIAFGLGKLDTAEAMEIGTHLEQCAECCETLLDLNDDTFVAMLRQFPDPSESLDRVTVGTTAEWTELSSDEAAGESFSGVSIPGESRDLNRTVSLPQQLKDHPRYRLIELIGEGGMGEVYRAEHRLMNRQVALKVINRKLVRDSRAVERFRREVRAAARLKHPNIVTAYDAEQAGDAHFLVMEFVDGTDLSSEVQHRGPLPIAQGCAYIRQAAHGLQHAYEQGMVHRDIKPHNLMLRPDGHVQILDFGLASLATETVLTEGDRTGEFDPEHMSLHLTAFGTVIGTPDYIAPEQAHDAHSSDIRGDIYSLGCTLYYLLTGKPPFYNFSADKDKLKAHAEQEPPSLNEQRENVPVELADIATRMLAKKPEDRFQIPAEVAEALAPLAEDDTILAMPMVQQPNFRGFLSYSVVWLVMLLLSGGIYVVTDFGRIEIQSNIDLQIAVMENGKQVDVIQVETGTQTRWLPTGRYRIVPHSHGPVTLNRSSFIVKRLSKEAIKVKSVDSSMLKGEPVAQPTNLINDPSFESTAFMLLPDGWSNWLNHGPEYSCEVVAGGHGGKRSLRISGKGTLGVVFANRIPVDRSKRYALKGWARFRGDPEGRAVIKFNYFNGEEWLGVNDLVGVKQDQAGWQFIEKTDALDMFPEAETLVATCHVEGNGTGWFDDLALIAYDRVEAPADFDSQHGRHNLTGPVLLDQWIGQWETEYLDSTATKLTMITERERKFGRSLMLSHVRTVESDEERLVILLFDQHAGAYRRFSFHSDGNVFEWRGQWDNASQSLKLRMLPDSSRITRIEQFIDADRIEASQQQVILQGVKDAGRWSSVRKRVTAKVVIPPSSGSAETPAELGILNRFVGHWSLDATAAPGMWNPEGLEETNCGQHVDWVLGGHFVFEQVWDANGQQMSLGLWTFDEKKETFLHWNFMPKGVHSQTRGTWDSGTQTMILGVSSSDGTTGKGRIEFPDSVTINKTLTFYDSDETVLMEGKWLTKRTNTD